jgi:hypothetical protein
MRSRIALVAALVSFGALAGCDNSCPTAAAFAEDNPDVSGSCSAPAPQQVAIDVQLCEACSHTTPTCEADTRSATGGSGDIFLDTAWEVCEDNRSCSNPACSVVPCRFSIPNGTYTVHAVKPNGTGTFQLTVNGAAASCTGDI